MLPEALVDGVVRSTRSVGRNRNLNLMDTVPSKTVYLKTPQQHLRNLSQILASQLLRPKDRLCSGGFPWTATPSGSVLSNTFESDISCLRTIRVNSRTISCLESKLFERSECHQDPQYVFTLQKQINFRDSSGSSFASSNRLLLSRINQDSRVPRSTAHTVFTRKYFVHGLCKSLVTSRMEQSRASR